MVSPLQHYVGKANVRENKTVSLLFARFWPCLRGLQSTSELEAVLLWR
jgi:hypothetical protein